MQCRRVMILPGEGDDAATHLLKPGGVVRATAHVKYQEILAMLFSEEVCNLGIESEF